MTSIRRSNVCVLFLIATMASIAAAQVVQIGGEVETPTYKMTVSAVEEPKPALKYLFLVPPVDQQKGNAATLYYKCMVFEAPDWLRWDPDLHEKVDHWLTMPLGELPREEIYSTVLHLKEESAWQDLREAGHRDSCEWEDNIRQFGVATLLPQTQKMRTLGRSIALRARLQIAEGKGEDAVATLGMGYALARDLGHAPCFVQVLVGNAIRGILDDQTRTLIAMERAPNLYWALTDYAAQTGNVRYALSYESRFWEFTVHLLDEIDKRPLTNDEALVLAGQVFEATNLADAFRNREGKAPITNRLAQAVWATRLYGQAREYLAKNGYDAQRIEGMPVLQAAILYRWKQFQEVRDNEFKWAMLPGDERLADTSFGEAQLRESELRLVGAPFTSFLPATSAIFKNLARVRRQTDLLRAVEALRMHAAQHGRWPQRLDEVTIVPVPVDCWTKKPFEYSVSGNVATLSAPLPPGTNWQMSGAARYELTLRPKGAN